MAKFNVGLQLFSVRDELEADLEGTLAEVARMGYDCVESAGLCRKSPEQFRAAVEAAGLRLVSTHTNLPADISGIPALVELHKALGAEYMAIPWMPVDRTPGEALYGETAAVIRAMCEAFRGQHLQLLYHNHDFEFRKIDGQYKLDLLFAEHPELWPEFDVCWVRFAGEDPAAYVLKYAGRVPVLHLKDFICEGYVKGEPVYELIGDDSTKGNKAKSGFEFRSVGAGCQDIPAILAAAEKAGTHTLIVEQDGPTPGLTPMECARLSRNYLKTLGV